MLINKIHIPIKVNTNKNKNNIKPIAPKTPSFSGHNAEQSHIDDYKNTPLPNILGQYLINQNITTPIEVYRNTLQEEINKNSFFNKNETLREVIKKMVFYAKNEGQLALINQVLTNEKLLNEDFITKIQYAIQATSNPAKQQLVSKILSNEILYTNENLISNIEKILYADDFENIVTAKISVIDKIIRSEILSKNKVFMQNLKDIISNIDSKQSADITNSVLDCILKDENCTQNEKFIGAIGQVFTTEEFHRRYGDALDEIKKEFGETSFYANVIGSIAYVLDYATLATFEKIMDNKSFIKDESLGIYAPKIVSLTLQKNADKIDNVIEYLKKNVNKQTQNKNEEIIREYMYYDFESLEEAKTFIDVENEALNKKYQLKETVKNLSDSDVVDFFDNNKRQIRTTIRLLGKDCFIHSFPTKLNGVRKLLDNCYLIQKNVENNKFEELLLKLNPKESQKYKEIQKEIQALKKQYPTTKINGNPNELKILQNKINTKTKEAQEILKNKINLDPNTKINKIQVIAGLIKGRYSHDSLSEKIQYSPSQKTNNDIDLFISLLKDYTPENEKIWNKAVAEKIFEKLDMEYNQTIAEKINFTKSKYIDEVISADLRFSKALKDIFHLVKNNPDKSILETFNTLPSNKKTKELFQKFNIDYDKWVNYDENSKVTIKYTMPKEEVLEISNRLLCKIFNDSSFKTLPENLINDLQNALGIEGIQLRVVKYFDGKDVRYSLPIYNPAMLKKAIRIIQNELNKDSWSAKHPDANINFTKTVIYDELIKATNKIRELLDTKSDDTNFITIKKVDMNNLVKSLFLGNDASCCTSVGTGAKQWTAPTYVKNKMFSAIEILDGNTPIGNSMCYFALVDNELAFVLDNVEFKPKYRNDDNIRDGIIEYSKQVCKEVGIPNIPIYMASHRNQLNLDHCFPDLKKVQIIGNTGEDHVYLDFLNTGDKVDFDSNIYTCIMMTRVA